MRSFMPFSNISERRIFQLGVKHVSRVDPKICELVRKHGLIELRIGGAPFESLVRAIISQQLNGQVAWSIFKKVKASLGSKHVDAQLLHRLSISKLRKAGVSPQKIRYLKDLSLRVVKGQLDLDGLKSRPDDEVIKILDEVKGIGPWTAHMFLLFTLGRTDVLPVGDLGIRTSIQQVYTLRHLPDGDKIKKIARNWHPYCSIASLYLWHAKDISARRIT